MRVMSTDGVALAVYEHGDPHQPTVVAVHGYPDDHRVWDGVAAILAPHYRVITYDVRGSGESDQPTDGSAYRMDQLVADLGAVLDAASPDRPVHLLAHDWGAIQSWPAVCDPRFADRISSFTSISGPSLDHAGAWLRTARHHPGASARQLIASSYIAMFQIPGLAERLLRRDGDDRVTAALGRIGRSVRASGDIPARTEANKINGLNLYRANMLRHVSRPRPQRTDIPVQVLAPVKDPFVTPALQTEAPRPFTANLRTRRIAGGHWVVSHRPDVIARLTMEFIELIEGGIRTPALVRADKSRAGTFAGKLVAVTGGGRGIGRATALEFARQGADVLIADIDDSAAKETVTLVQALGVDAAEYHLDVSVAQAWERFAEQVRQEHGVADVIVNNAGIGMGGSFLGTSTADWENVIGVNLWGVIHGSRLFAEQMVQRGEGGHIVNIASAAAYSPSRIYPAYATTKAAVLMLTECLRAELARENIGVTAICPGFIATDISRTTVHVGVDEATQQSLREHAVASYGRRNYLPERVAKHAVRAASRNKPVAAITVESKVLRALTRYAPPLARQIAKIDLNKL